MNWDAIGAVGEIIGALAVVATLGYLALQVKTNTAAVNQASRQATLSGRAEAGRWVAGNSSRLRPRGVPRLAQPGRGVQSCSVWTPSTGWDPS